MFVILLGSSTKIVTATNVYPKLKPLNLKKFKVHTLSNTPSSRNPNTQQSSTIDMALKDRKKINKSRETNLKTSQKQRIEALKVDHESEIMHLKRTQRIEGKFMNQQIEDLKEKGERDMKALKLRLESQLNLKDKKIKTLEKQKKSERNDLTK